MTELQIIYVKDCIKAKDMHRFYIWSEWLKVRKRVLDLDKDECQDCKAKGIYTKATTVHHINHVKNRPDLALEIYTNDGLSSKYFENSLIESELSTTTQTSNKLEFLY